MSDRVDEWLISHLREFEGKELKSISQGKVDLDKFEDEQTKEKQKQDEKEFVDVVKQIKDALGKQVKDVRVTHRLTDSPACVVFDEQDLTGHMQRMLKAAGQTVMETQPILEVNPEHPILLKIKNISDKDRLAKWSEILLNQALLAEGESLQDPAGFVKKLNALLVELPE